MTDTITKEKRSWVMSRVAGKDTKPEVLLRSLLHRRGFRFRLHGKNLPGKPDIVLPKYRAIVFVNGCFWHSHKKCKRARMPKSRREYWIDKLEKNVRRDREQQKKLKSLGWLVVVVWECELKEDSEKAAADVSSKLLRRPRGGQAKASSPAARRRTP